jgi:hypothetical protein
LDNKVKVTTTISRPLVAKFKQIAKKEGRNFNYYLELGLKKILKEKEK